MISGIERILEFVLTSRQEIIDIFYSSNSRKTAIVDESIKAVLGNQLIYLITRKIIYTATTTNINMMMINDYTMSVSGK